MHTHVHTYTHTHIHAHTQTHTHMHTHIHAQKHNRVDMKPNTAQAKLCDKEISANYLC